MRTLRDQLNAVIAAYLKATGLAASTLSRRVFDRHDKIARLASGEADLLTARFEEKMAWFAANWPAGTPWPEGIARPSDVTAGSPAPSRCGASQSAREARS